MGQYGSSLKGVINSKLSDMLSNGYNPADAINEVSKEYGLTKEDVIKYYREEFKINPLKWTEDALKINDKIYSYYLNDKYQIRCANYIILAIKDGVVKIGLTPRGDDIFDVIRIYVNKIDNFNDATDRIYATKRFSKEEKSKHSKLLYQCKVNLLCQERNMIKSELYQICKVIASIRKRFLRRSK